MKRALSAQTTRRSTVSDKQQCRRPSHREGRDSRPSKENGPNRWVFAAGAGATEMGVHYFVEAIGRRAIWEASAGRDEELGVCEGRDCGGGVVGK